MIHFLISSQTFVNCSLNCTRLPVDCPVFLFSFFNIFKPVVFKCKPYYFYVVIVQQKVIAFVCWWSWFNVHWVFIRSENQKVFSDFF